MQTFNIDQFKYRIRLFVELIIVAFVCISVWSVVAERKAVISSAERNVAGYARALAEHSESAFAESDRVLRDLLHDLSMEGKGHQISLQEYFLELRRQAADSPQIGAIFLVNKDGVMFTNSNEYPPRQISVADREYYRFYLDHPSAELTLSKPVMSRLVNRWRFNLMRPLNRAGEPFEGIAAVAFEVSYFQSFFNASSLGPSGRIALVRADGAPLVCEPMVNNIYDADLGNSTLFRDKLPTAPFGIYHVASSVMDGSKRIVAYQRLKRFPVVSMVSVKENDILGPWKVKAMQQLALTFAVSLVLAYLTRLILRHLDRLKSALAVVEGQQEQLLVKAAQIDAANDAILQIDAGGKLIQFNQALSQMTGYGAEELSGFRLQEILAPPFAGSAPINTGQLEEGPVTYESAFRSKDGRTVPVDVHALMMSRGANPVILNIARDITQRKLTEERESARLKILEAMATGVQLQELLPSIIRFVERESPGGLGSVLLYDETSGKLRVGSAPSLPDFYNRAVDGIPVGTGTCGTAAFLRKRVIVEEIEGHPAWRGFAPAREAGLRACWSEPILASDGKLLGTFAFYHLAPKAPAPEELSLIESAAHLASLAIERVRGDENRKRLEEQLLHVQKIDAIGQLAAGIAHDFNNLLTPVMVYAGLLKASLADNETESRKVAGINSAALKAKELTQKLLSFGRKQMLHKEVLDLNEVVSSFQDIMARTIRENINLRVQLFAEPLDVHADRGQLEQILLNLTVNAQDAISANGTVTVRTERRVLERSFVKSRPGLKSGPYCLLSFSDNGCGMDQAIMQHIFEPFFTTKPVGHGTGLGLATVYGIIKQHEGYVEVKSKIGEGTTFDIYFPVAPHAAKPPEAPPARVHAPIVVEAGKRVLVVEDNDVVRDMAVDLLTSAGYSVLVADGPLAARELVMKETGEINLLVTDVIMPDMNGLELYAALVKVRPGLPVLYMTGYADDLVTRGICLGSADDLLRKPFTSEVFLESVERKLGAEGRD